MQLFGGRGRSIFALAARLLTELGADIIDINAGCPYLRLLGQQAGAYCWRPKVLEDIIKVVRANTDLPVTG